jgi:serine/threonine-protein kinase
MSDVLTRLNDALEGRYRVESQLGEGGMATVYLADDLKHERKVALKVLKPELAAVVGGERFLGEIKTTANLQHPHILPLFDSGEADGFLFYVMPYVEGETLRARIDRDKQLGVEEAVRMTKSISSALDYAHRHGVIHRDVKPENVLLHDGEPLVADFGIALAVTAAGGGRLTETGLSLGTPYYMSPEQAAADRDPGPQSDVYSLACILYEMLIGDPPHTGSSAQAVLAKILTEKPRAVTDLRETVPPHVGSAIARGLERLPADRFSTAAAFSEALDDVAFAHVTAAETAPVDVTEATNPTATSRRWIAAIPWAIAAVATAVALLPSGRDASEAPVTRVAIHLPEGQEFSKSAMFAGTRASAVSPDGSELVYRSPDPATGSYRLLRRRLDELEATPIQGTESAMAPKYSRDGTWLAFRSNDRGQIGVMPAGGGTPEWLEAPIRFEWGDDGAIYYESDGAILRWTPGTADPESVGTVDGRGGVTDVLPGGRGVLMARAVADASIYVWDADSEEVRVVGEGRGARYLDTGHLIYRRSEDDVLIAQPFDAETLETTGPAVTTSDLVGASGNGGEFSFAVDGTLLYASGGTGGAEQLVWIDRTGRAEPIEWLESGSFDGLALSASGDSVVAGWSPGSSTSDGDIWLFDLQGRARLPLTRDGLSTRPQWHPTEPLISFVGRLDDDPWLMTIPTTGAGAPSPLVALPTGPADGWWTRDGTELLVRARGVSVRSIFRFIPGQDSVPSPWLDREFNERSPEPSPDGNWLVYSSDQSGRSEVYAQPYPDGGRVESVSIEGASQPAWSRDGTEVFYIGSDGWMWAAAVAYDASSFVVESRERLFEISTGVHLDTQRRLWDVAPDGRFLFSRLEGAVGGVQLILVRNWVQEATGESLDR